MKKTIVILMISFTFAGFVPSAQDVANHALTAALGTKIVKSSVLWLTNTPVPETYNSYQTTKHIKDQSNDAAFMAFLFMSVIFFWKEIADWDGTGFSINDLVYDYVGLALILWEVDFL